MRLELLLLMIVLNSCTNSIKTEKVKDIKTCGNISLYMSYYEYSQMDIAHNITYKLLFENESSDSIFLKGKIVTYDHKKDWFFEHKYFSGKMPPNSKRSFRFTTSPLEPFNNIKIGEIPNLIYISSFGDTCRIVVSEQYIQFNVRDTIITFENDDYLHLR